MIGRWLPVDDARLLELGCGAAFTTRRLAEAFAVREIIAMEVDRIQHEKNLLIPDLPQVTFVFGGAQAIDLPDESVDAVIMLKSLHHVPVGDMDRAFSPRWPGCCVRVASPMYLGTGLRRRVQRDPAPVQRRKIRARGGLRGNRPDRVATGHLELEREMHFLSTSRFAGFEEFEQRIIGATHSEFDIDDTLYAEVKARFLPHLDQEGVAEFLNPMRVDLLRKPH